MKNVLQTATLAGGCFWCVEAVFKRLKGVISVVPGYSGGTVVNPTYEQVASGRTGHTEAIQITFDPAIITFEKLLDVFWAVHDPTTLNRQGHDVGTQYRSAIFYYDAKQKQGAERSMERLAASGTLIGSIVTELVPYSNFYPADASHKDFYDRNREFGYCRFVIDPKIQKLYKNFAADLKEGTA